MACLPPQATDEIQRLRRQVSRTRSPSPSRAASAVLVRVETERDAAVADLRRATNQLDVLEDKLKVLPILGFLPSPFSPPPPPPPSFSARPSSPTAPRSAPGSPRMGTAWGGFRSQGVHTECAKQKCPSPIRPDLSCEHLQCWKL